MAYILLKDTCCQCGRVLEEGEQVLYTATAKVSREPVSGACPGQGQARPVFVNRKNSKQFTCQDCVSGKNKKYKSAFKKDRLDALSCTICGEPFKAGDLINYATQVEIREEQTDGELHSQIMVPPSINHAGCVLKHPRRIVSISPQELGKQIAGMHYDSLRELLFSLSDQLELDAEADRSRGREKLSLALTDAHLLAHLLGRAIGRAWMICAPFTEQAPLRRTKGSKR